jgi:hypothetical protein
MKNKKLTKFVFILWIILVLPLVGFTGFVLGAWATGYIFAGGQRLSTSQANIVLGLASIPSKVRTLPQSIKILFSDDPLPMLLDREVVEEDYWLRQFPSPEDTGYLLLSGVDPDYKQPNIRLIRISDGVILNQWNPNFKHIHAQIKGNKYAPKPALKNIAPLHPLLLPNGEIVFNVNSQGPMVKMGLCEGEVEEIFDIFSHHSIEIDDSNTHLVTSSIADYYFSTVNPYLQANLRDDSILKITFDGEVIENLSFSKILVDNGLESLLFGHMGSGFEPDPIHLNQVSVAKSDGSFWLKGDYLISARNLSTVFLYRPSTNKITWYQSGPWKNQHSAKFVDKNRIALFDNNVYSQTLFVRESDINRIFIVDFSSGTAQTSEPFKKLLESTHANPKTRSQGIVQVLPDGGLFIEETNYGRHLRFDRDKLLWSRVNDYDKNRIGMIFWSRYLTQEEGNIFIEDIRKLKDECGNN